MSEEHKMLRNADLRDGSRTFDRAESARIVAGSRAEALARIEAEAGTIAAMKAAATPPAICGPDIPVAPARGAFAVFQPRRLVPGSSGTAIPDGYRGPGEVRHRAALRRADVFDRMIEEARSRHERKGEAAGPFVPPLSPGQVAMARTYRDLVEDHDGKGIKCASLEASRGGGGSGSFIDTFVEQGIAIERVRARIGTGAAMKVRRIRPSARGGASAVLILDRTLVDMVCLRDMTLTMVLRTHGWANTARNVGVVRAALTAALDRMQGYRDRGPQNVA